MKTFKSINQQVKLLTDRGIIFSSIKDAKDILSRKNFYNIINGYKRLFCVDTNNDTYIQNLSFNEVYSLYEFDTNLRNLFLKYVLIAEQEFKTHVAYEFAKTRGGTNWNLLKSYDTTTEAHKNEAKVLIARLKEESKKKKKDSQDDLIKHFNKIPIWAFVNVFALGLIKKFYFCMKEEDRCFVAQNYYKISFSYLRSFLESLNMFRNVFAHNFRVLFYRIKDIDKQIKDTPIHSLLNIDKTNNYYYYGKNDLFSIVIVLKYMLCKKDFDSLYCSLISLFDEVKQQTSKINYNQVINSIGFFEDDETKTWKNIITIKNGI